MTAVHLLAEQLVLYAELSMHPFILDWPQALPRYKPDRRESLLPRASGGSPRFARIYYYGVRTIP
jgi:hypothetical protein